MIFEVMLGDMMLAFLKEVLTEAQKLDDDTLSDLNKRLGEERP